MSLVVTRAAPEDEGTCFGTDTDRCLSGSPDLLWDGATEAPLESVVTDLGAGFAGFLNTVAELLCPPAKAWEYVVLRLVAMVEVVPTASVLSSRGELLPIGLGIADGLVVVTTTGDSC